MSANDLEKMSKEEFDVDTGTYMEDVHANDSIVGMDADSDGLIDSVEKLVQDADARAKAYNEEKDRQEREREQGQSKQEQEKDDKDNLEATM